MRRENLRTLSEWYEVLFQNTKLNWSRDVVIIQIGPLHKTWRIIRGNLFVYMIDISLLFLKMFIFMNISIWFWSKLFFLNETRRKDCFKESHFRQKIFLRKDFLRKIWFCFTLRLYEMVPIKPYSFKENDSDWIGMNGTSREVILEEMVEETLFFVFKNFIKKSSKK